MAYNEDERNLKKTSELNKVEKSDVSGKLDTNFYVPKKSEYKPRAKDISNKAQRKEEQRKKGLIKRGPGVQTEAGKEYVKKLEEITGEKQDKIGSYDEAPGGGTPLARGTKAPSDEWVKEHRKMQPRDPETGQFEYNNANAKGVKYPSRGKKALTFIEGPDFDEILERNQHIIITDENKTAISRLDMTEDEFREALINASEKLGFTTRWATESKKGRKSKRELEALEKEERGRIGSRVESEKDYGPEKVSSYDKEKNALFDKDYQKQLSKGEERAIAATDSDQEKFKQDLDALNETKAWQERKKEQEYVRSEARAKRDKALNSSWSSGKIDNELIEAVGEVYPTKKFTEAKNPAKVIQNLMNLKDKNGNQRFKNFEDFRHWAMANHANKNQEEEE